MSDDKATCFFFVYQGGEIDSLGARWALWLERFKIYIDSSGISDAAKIKSKLLLMMGEEAYQTYKVLKKPDDTESAEQIYKLMTDHFNPKRSVFTERVRFRQTNKLPNEQVNAFALRLRERATYCKFEATLDENILEQFVVGCGMFEFQRECCRKDDLTLERALDIARGYERTECNVQGMFHVAARNRSSGPRAVIEVSGKKIDFLVDTGSAANVIDEATLAELKPKPKLRLSKGLYFGFKSTEPLAVIGEFTTSVRSMRRSRDATFIVVPGRSECLLSYKTASN